MFEINADFKLQSPGWAFLHSLWVCCKVFTPTQQQGGIVFVSQAHPTQSELAKLMAVRSERTVRRGFTICEKAGLVAVERIRRRNIAGSVNIYTLKVPARYVYLHKEDA
jgi:hypothetical protein